MWASQCFSGLKWYVHETALLQMMGLYEFVSGSLQGVSVTGCAKIHRLTKRVTVFRAVVRTWCAVGQRGCFLV